MFGFKRPFKLRIAQCLAGAASLSARELLDALLPEYGAERQCSLETIEYHLQALKAVGLVRVAAAALDGEALAVRYALTPAGRARCDRLVR